MASYDWGQSQRGLISDFQLQSFAGEGAPLSSNVQHDAEIEFSDIDLGLDTHHAAETKVSTADLLVCSLMGTAASQFVTSSCLLCHTGQGPIGPTASSAQSK